MNSLFVRAVFAFLALPGVVAFAVPVLLVARGSTVDWRMAPLAAAALLLSLGIGLLLWCVREFYVVGRGTLAPWEPPRHLVTSGPYRVSRNPMYVAVLLIMLGWAVLFGSWTVVVYAGAVAPMVHLRVRYHEEPYLARAHGDAWQDYATRVPRWIWLVRRRAQAGEA
jgi:protein-S-isoprenylcysteine O-methyltransferase Ste14